jgi:hypothetical protein
MFRCPHRLEATLLKRDSKFRSRHRVVREEHARPKCVIASALGPVVFVWVRRSRTIPACWSDRSNSGFGGSIQVARTIAHSTCATYHGFVNPWPRRDLWHQPRRLQPIGRRNCSAKLDFERLYRHSIIP